MVSLIGSKQILEPVTIHAQNKQGDEVKDFKRFMQLSRAGNYTLITYTKTLQDPWRVDGVFIKKLLVGFNRADVDTIADLDIALGETHFHFSGRDIKTWRPFDMSVIESDLQDVTLSKYVVFEIPQQVSRERSRIPVYSSFFSSIINWAGDEALFIEPAKHAFVQTLLLLVIMGLMRIIFIHIFILHRSCQETLEVESAQHNHGIFAASIMATLCCLSILTAGIYFLYHPDISAILQSAHDTYLSSFYKSFRPKPVERMQFVVGVLFAPIILLIVYHSIRKSNWLQSGILRKIYTPGMWLTGIIIFFWWYIGLALSGFFFVRDSITSQDYLRYIFYCIAFPVALAYFFSKKHLHIVLRIILLVCIIFSFLIVFCSNIIVLSSNFLSITFDPVIYPVSQVLAGKGLLVNLNCLYGMFPTYLAPLFMWTGVTVYSFTVVLASIICFSLFCILRFMRIVIKDDTIFYTGFLFVVVYTLLATRTSPEQYFQYWPIRYIFPCLSLILSAQYLKKPSKTVYYASFLIYGTAVLWNFDVGIIVWLTWILTLIYNEFSFNNSFVILLKNSATHIFLSIGGLLAAVGIFVLMTWSGTGTVPHLPLFFEFQKMFLSGYFMIKLVPPPHLWSVVLFVYLIGLYVAVRALYEKNIEYKHKIILLLVSTGVGLFSYYEGQASDVTLFRVWYPALVLLVVFTDILVGRIRSLKYPSYFEYVIVALLFSSFISAPLTLLYNSDVYIRFIRGAMPNNDDKNSYASTISFLRARLSPKEETLILASFKQGIYYAETGTRSAVNLPSVPDILYPKDMETLISFLASNKKVKVFAEQPLSSYDIYDPRIKNILMRDYKEIERSAYGMSFFLPKK
jgi:hypothetical protein